MSGREDLFEEITFAQSLNDYSERIMSKDHKVETCLMCLRNRKECLVCLRNRKDAIVARTEWIRG